MLLDAVRHSRRTLAAAALVALLAASASAPGKAAGARGEEPSVLESGSYTGISLAYPDAARINAILDDSGWSPPRLDDGPILVWTSGSNAHLGRVRLGFNFGFGSRSVTDTATQAGTRITLYRGDLRADYLLPTGLGTSPTRPDGALSLLAGTGLGVAYGTLRIENTDTSLSVPIFREADRWLITLSPALGVVFTPSRLAHLELSASYSLALPLGGPRRDGRLDPGASLLRGLSIHAGVILASY